MVEVGINYFYLPLTVQTFKFLFMNWKSIVLIMIVLVSAFSSVGQPTAFTTCPNANVAVARPGGGGAVTNPFSIYDINPATGAATLLSGPIKDPADTSINLQINGVGLNVVDGFLYGLFSDAPATLSTVPSTPYYRLGANSEAVQLGTLSGPPFQTGENGSFVIPNAGEFDQSGTYYFPAITGVVNINFLNLPASTFSPGTFYIGSLTGSNAMTAGTAALSPTYAIITNPTNDASAYFAASSMTITATSSQSLGLQDLVYNSSDGNLYTYVTYTDSTSTGFFGQMLKVNPTTGVLSAVAAPAIQSFITSTVFPNGMLIDANGNFLIMLTNGDIYQAVGTASAYTGAITLLNTSSGLPTSLTGDMASCGMMAIALPFSPFSFDLRKMQNGVELNWENINEENLSHYVIQFSEDGNEFKNIAKVAATSEKTYSYMHENTFSSSVSFYRIASVDREQKISYSEVKTIHSEVKTVESSVSNIRIFPNPVRSELVVNLPKSWINSKVQVELLNTLGQVVFVKKIAEASISETVSLNDTELHAGLYIIRLSNGQSVYTQSIIKE